jgi:hypothetical protein
LMSGRLFAYAGSRFVVDCGRGGALSRRTWN